MDFTLKQFEMHYNIHQKYSIYSAIFPDYFKLNIDNVKIFSTMLTVSVITLLLGVLTYFIFAADVNIQWLVWVLVDEQFLMVYIPIFVIISLCVLFFLILACKLSQNCIS